MHKEIKYELKIIAFFTNNARIELFLPIDNPFV